MCKHFPYINDKGYHKTLSVCTDKVENGEYPFQIWDREHGDLCGTGTATKQEINDLLAYYGVKERL